MIKIKSKNQEYNLFNKLSDEWWDENGEFKILHRIKPIRLEYVLSQFKDYKVKNLDILDIGCGGGLVSEPLCKLGGNVTGIDFSENNIDICKFRAEKNNLKIKYICNDIEKINLKKKYDLIIMFEVLEHLEDWRKFLIKIKRNLKTNGKIIISTINRNSLSKFLTIYLGENVLNWIPKGTHDYNKFIKPEEINIAIKKIKLKSDNLKGLTFNPIVNEWYMSNSVKVNYFCTLKNI